MGMTRRPALEIVAKPLELPYECPHSGSKCSVIGNISELVKHLEDDHNVRETRFHSQPDDGYEFIHNHNHNQSRSGDLQNPPGMFAVLNCYGQRFCYHFELFLFGTAPCYIVFLRFMGEDTEAKKFRYSFKVSKNGRDLTWQGVPSSIRDSHHKVCDIQDGLVIPRNLILLFLDESEQKLKLRLEGRIWKT
ncbi:E3 ubiquitin protein ligase SINAT2-like protein [Tanacetum coccineum]